MEGLLTTEDHYSDKTAVKQEAPNTAIQISDMFFPGLLTILRK
jgi:hypothetical protein